MENNNEEFDLSLRPLFLGLSEDGMNKIIELSEEVKFKKGEYIVKENTFNQNIYILKTGKVSVIIENIVDEETQKLITLDSKPTMYNLYIGDLIGELSIIDLEPTSASVIADEDTVCLKISGEQVFKALGNSIEDRLTLITNLARTISRRLRNTNKLLSKYFVQFYKQN
jgi:CRP/FNR family transcriptional regulator, cyclic AMP receptor protein